MKFSHTAILAATIFVGTLFVLWRNSPEERTFVSDDTQVTVIAQAVVGAWMTVSSLEDGSYRITSSQVGRPAVLRFKSNDRQARLGYYDSTFGMWRLALTEYDVTTDELVTTSSWLNTRWRSFEQEQIARPNLDTERAALVDAQPERAVGYAAEVGYRVGDDEPIVLDGETRSGGCAGEYRYTGETTLTSVEVSFSDALSYLVVVLWQLGEGCEGYEVIE